MTELSSQSLGDSLGQEIVTLYVGSKRKKFVVHKQLLCNSCEFFEKGFAEDAFREGKEGKMHLSHDSPSVISLFIDWLYRERVPEGHSQQYLDDLYDLYFFAVKLDMAFLMDQTMDRIQDTCARYDKYISPECLRKIYRNTMQSKRAGGCLREFASYLFMFELLKSQQEALDEAVNEEDKRNMGYYVHGMFNFPSPDPKEEMTPFKLSSEAIRIIWDLGKDDFDLFEELFHQFQAGNVGVVDPRMRNDDNPDDRCFFHAHHDTKEEEDICYLDYRVKNPTWIENGAEQNKVSSQKKSRENQEEPRSLTNETSF